MDAGLGEIHIRAYEHWNGNTQVILQDIIYRLVEQGAFTPSG